MAYANGCAGFYDLGFDPWKFGEYDKFFNEESTFTLAPAGTFTGLEAIKEYVKFASDESPFVDAFRTLPGGLALLKTASSDTSACGSGGSCGHLCTFLAMGHRRYELSARYSSGEAVHVAAMSSITYSPTAHKVTAIVLYYETPFMQYVFDSLRSRRESYDFVCNLLYYECPNAFTLGDTRAINQLDSHQDCVERMEMLPEFDSGPRLDQ